MSLPPAQVQADPTSVSTKGHDLLSSLPPSSASKAQQLSQSDRNRMELPDITKGVPWLPHDAPIILPTDPDAGKIKEALKTVISSQWTPPAGLMEGFTEDDVKVM